ncbi:MAG: glycoside hydrolase family protein [Spirosomataceae bacterium]
MRLFFLKNLWVIFLLCFSLSGIAQDDLDLNKFIQPIDSSQIFITNDYYTWCNSAIKGKDGKYHLFYARWPHGKRALDDDSMNYIFDGFKGWLKYSEIAYAVSDHLYGPYKHVKTIIKGNGDSTRWDRYTMHNPQIRQFKGKYYLYYISNAFDPNYTLKNAQPDWLHWLKYNCTQKIGVLVANSIQELVDGHFKRIETPLMEVDNTRTFEVTTNPSVCEGPDGKYYMIFKSRKPNVGNMTHWIATSNKPDEPFQIQGEVFTSAEMACEDPCLWYDKKRKRFYAVVKYFSRAQKLVTQFGALALITSKDGLHWDAASHPLVSMRKLTFKSGKTIELANLERPFVVTDKKGQAIALFAAAAQQAPNKGEGTNTFAVSISLKK